MLLGILHKRKSKSNDHQVTWVLKYKAARQTAIQQDKVLVWKFPYKASKSFQLRNYNHQDIHAMADDY